MVMIHQRYRQTDVMR